MVILNCPVQPLYLIDKTENDSLNSSRFKLTYLFFGDSYVKGCKEFCITNCSSFVK